MNWLDFIIIALMIVSALIGLKIGVIKAALSLVGVIVGVVLAGRYNDALALRLGFIPQANLARIAAFIIILVVVMVITGVIARLLTWLSSITMLGWLNHLGGALFGLILGAIFCGALLAIWSKFSSVTGPISGSALATILLDRLPLVLALLPGEFGTIRSFLQK